MIICKDIFCSHKIKQKQHRRVHLLYLSTSICLQPNQTTCAFYMSLRFMRCSHFFIKVSKKVIVYFCVCTWHPDLVTGLLHLNIKDIVQLPFSKKNSTVNNPNTVENRSKDTHLIRKPVNSGQFRLSWLKVHIFSLKLTRLIRRE